MAPSIKVHFDALEDFIGGFDGIPDHLKDKTIII